MKITLVRRISQIFFFVLFLWFCIVSTIGIKWWQIRGWPVDLFLQLDPLVAIGTILTTHTWFTLLLWSLVTIIFTIIFGRFFCGWVCPFGAIHHFAGYMSSRKKGLKERIDFYRYRKAQNIKYYILIFFLIISLLPKSINLLLTGLLDPIPLITRSINLMLLPIADMPFNITSANARSYEGSWFILIIFFGAVALNLVIPRFYCRIICPLGALFGIIGRYSIWRIGKKDRDCRDDKQCERSCEGGCDPAGKIKVNECILCFNCTEACNDLVMKYQTKPSAAGETVNPGISRKGFLLSIGSGLFLAPALRLSGNIDKNWNYKIIRPPGALAEDEFLNRCIKCGQCMRVCPSNVIQPGGIEHGFENLWTPVLNNRVGASGCQYSCVACGQVCPTSAIRPITLQEKHGIGRFSKSGRIKIGAAFIDRNRCLPWAMNKPCIVCQENCPVSPKAIYTDDVYSTIRDGIKSFKSITGKKIEIFEDNLPLDDLSTGDYYYAKNEKEIIRITSYSNNVIELDSNEKETGRITPGKDITVQVHLKRPYVDIEKCNGCGICEHECPISGLRAVRVSPENETRSRQHSLLIKRS